MEQQSTLVLLGVNAQPEVYDKMVIHYVARIIPIIEHKVRDAYGDVFVIIDKSIHRDFYDMLPLISTGRRKYQFVELQDPDKKTFERIREHFKMFPGSILLLFSEKSISDKLAVIIGIQEATVSKLLLNVIQLPA